MVYVYNLSERRQVIKIQTRTQVGVRDQGEDTPLYTHSHTYLYQLLQIQEPEKSESSITEKTSQRSI